MATGVPRPPAARYRRRFLNPTTVQFPAITSAYFYAELCTGWIDASIPTSTSTAFATGISNPVDLIVKNDDKPYYLARGTDTVLPLQSRIPPHHGRTSDRLTPVAALASKATVALSGTQTRKTITDATATIVRECHHQ